MNPDLAQFREKLVRLRDQADRAIDYIDGGGGVSRQLLWQQEHKASGLCQFCSRPLHPESIALCAVHRTIQRKRMGRTRSYGRTRWATVDWSKHNQQIADELGVTWNAVENQRKKLIFT